MKVVEKDFSSFFKVPFEVRGKNSLYAAPFRPDLKKMLSVKNPIFKSENDFTYYTLFKEGRVAGRISAHIHHDFNSKFKTQKCYFGFFECINDQEVANKLFELAESFARKHACDTLSGNFNLTAMQEMGVMIGGFENEPYILQSYGMPYYPGLFEKAGFHATFPMSTFEIDLLSIDPEKIVTEKQKVLLNDPEYEIIPITKKEYPKLAPVILDIFNRGFDMNALFVPLTREEFDFQAKDLVYFMDSSISFLARHKGVPIGLSIHIPDMNPVLRASSGALNLKTLYYFIINKMKRDRTLCVFSAVLPDYQKQGIMGAIVYKTLKAMKARGYKTLGITWISESNAGSMRKMKDTNARKLHDLRIYEKPVTPSR
jgi:GNAT superfamily N-acetyltransferase